MFGRVNWLFGKSYDVSHAMFTGRFGQVLDPDRKLFFGPNVAWNFLPGSWGFPLATQATQPVVIRISQWVVGTSSRLVEDVHIKSVPNHPFSSRTFQPWPWWQPPRWDFDFFERTCGNIKVEVTLPKGQVIGSTPLGIVWFSWGEIFN